jgi:sulfite reductase beta subunit-like hemoprotein
MPVPAKPTAIERDKAEIGFDFDFKQLADTPLEQIPPSVVALFKWTGIYQQLQRGFFMVRVRLPGGLITADQLDALADLADRFAQGQLCLTTRQTFQLHHVRKDDLWRVLEGLAAVGLDTKNACGDVNRNVVTCALQGVCPHEIGDVRPRLLALANDSEIKDRQRNLPRKHKMSVAGCDRACGLTLMNCQGYHPVRRSGPDGTDEIGYRFFAGGGLGARPYMAKVIFDWVHAALVLHVARASIEVFRVQGDRSSRALARLKILVDRLGPRRFGEEVLAELQRRGVPGLDRIEPATNPAADIKPSFLDGQAVIPQRQEGFVTLRIRVPRGDLDTSAARTLARCARRFGDGSIMPTARQNIQLRFVRPENLAALTQELSGFRLDGCERAPDVVSCVGTTMCNLAVSDTPAAARKLVAAFENDRALTDKVGSLRIHLNGCPNSCTHHSIGDIGLRGMRRQAAAGSEEGFSVWVGGSVEGPGHIGQMVTEIPATAVEATVRRLLEIFLERRQDGTESFGAFSRRVGPVAIASWLGNIAEPADPLHARNLRLTPVFHDMVEEARLRGR